MPDKFEDLSTYISVLDCGGVNAAAAELGIAKSAVSRRISDLERRLGVSLIDRSSRRSGPTALGLEYASRARAILKSLDELDTSVASDGEGGTVTIRAARSIIAHRLIPALAKIDGETRSITVQLIDDVASDTAWDIRVGLGSADAATRVLFLTTAVLCAAPSYMKDRAAPVTQGALDAERTIGIGNDGSRPYNLSTPDADAAAAAAIAGLGIACLPDYVVAGALVDGSLIRLPDVREAKTSQVVAWCSEDATTSARKLVDALATALG